MTRYLIAPPQTGFRDGQHFSWTVPGELLLPAMICDRDRLAEDEDAGCGCSRSFVGMSSATGTTQAVVAEVAHDRAELVELAADAHRRVGLDFLDAEEDVDWLADTAADAVPGTVFVRSFDELREDDTTN